MNGGSDEASETRAWNLARAVADVRRVAVAQIEVQRAACPGAVVDHLADGGAGSSGELRVGVAFAQRLQDVTRVAPLLAATAGDGERGE